MDNSLANQPPLAPERPAATEPPLTPAEGSRNGGNASIGPRGAKAPASDASPSAGAMAGWVREFPWAAWLTSTVIHAALVVILSLLLLNTPQDELLWLTSTTDAGDFENMEVDFEDVPAIGDSSALGTIATADGLAVPGPRSAVLGSAQLDDNDLVAPSVSAGPLLAPLAPIGESAAENFNTALEGLDNPLTIQGGGLEGRAFENRLEMALSGGGSRESEAAVELGLAWLAEHQFEDGGWRFDLEQHPRCAGYCRNSGSNTSSTAATGLALLSFLGAGYTHKEGKYSDVVRDGLYYLEERMQITSRGGDLRDSRASLDAVIELGAGRLPNRAQFRPDTMYAHGIASVALTEAYAMSRDPALRQPAENAVKFIINAQYDDGGWRYNPKWENQGPGDMTVTGWQLAALKSAVLAGIEVPYEVWIRASAFVDGLQEDGGSRYAYRRGDRGTPATTAIGLLCRMIGGWPRDARPLQRGAAQIGDRQPSQNNMYFNYYASQVLHHVGGSNWRRWNPRMRDYLVGAQSQEGHEIGSWYFSEDHSSQGGRLYTTAMAIMTLEVYYRYMPLYSEPFVGRAP